MRRKPLIGLAFRAAPLLVLSCPIRSSDRERIMIESTELEVWTTPDFVEYETPMEVTAYVARMEE